MKGIKHLFLLIFCISPLALFSQENIITGYVFDANSKESIIGATIFEVHSGKGTITNKFGYFSLNLGKTDSITLAVSFVGYKTQVKDIESKEDYNVIINLREGYDLKEVMISANEKAQKRNSGLSTISVKDIQEIPNITGQPDLLKAFQYLPGVISGTEGSTNLHVRGGSPDQNLILLDDIPLYYVNHVGGFISIFDQQSIKHVNLYKGAFPARYGGRLSSVLDIRMKDGNMNAWHGGFNISPLNSGVFIEGPVKKEKSSIILSIRRSNVDLFTRLLSRWQSKGSTIYGYTSYDFNFKYNQIINQKNRVYFSIYSGRDNFLMKGKQKESNLERLNPEYAFTYNLGWKTQWGNTMGSIRWNHVVNPQFFGNITLAYSRFAYINSYDFIQKRISDDLLLENTNHEFSSGIEDIIFKADFDYTPHAKHKIKFGFSNIYHIFNPGTVDISIEQQNTNNIDTVYGNSNVFSIENYAYFEDEIDFNKYLFGNFGIGFSDYYVNSKHFVDILPRIKLGSNITHNSTLIISYSRMNQNIHLLSNSSIGLPTDLWVPATKLLAPEISDQISIGFTHDINPVYQLKLEGFYKSISNLIDYKSGANFFTNPADWEDKVETDGIGRVKGIEFLLHKKTGSLSGWLAYSISKNERKFENINSGSFFPYKFDKRNDISLVLLYKINKHISFSSSWVFSSGPPITLSGKKYRILDIDYKYGGDHILENKYETGYDFSNKHNVRMPPFHRLDIGLKYSKEKKRGNAIWSFSVYNVYNRKNPYLLYYKTEDNVTNLYKFSLLPIIPSVSYSFYF